MVWWQALTILMQGAAAGVPMWVLLWAIDRLRGAEGSEIDADALHAEWEGRYREDAGPVAVPSRSRYPSTIVRGLCGWLKAGDDYFPVDQYSLKVGSAVIGSIRIPIRDVAEIGRLMRATDGTVDLNLFRQNGKSFAFAARLWDMEATALDMRIHANFEATGPIVLLDKPQPRTIGMGGGMTINEAREAMGYATI